MAIADLVLLGLLICSYFSGWPKAFEPLIGSEYGAKLLLLCMVGFPLFLLLQLAAEKWLHSRWGRFLLQCAGVPFLAYLWSLYPPLPLDAWSFDLFARSAAILIIPLCGVFLLRSPKPDTAQRGVAGWMLVAGLVALLLLMAFALGWVGLHALEDLWSERAPNEIGLTVAVPLTALWLGLFVLVRPGSHGWLRWLFRVIGLLSLPALLGLAPWLIELFDSRVDTLSAVLGLSACLWLSSMLCIVIFSRKEGVRILLGSLIFMACAMSLGPWSAFSLSESAHTATLMSQNRKQLCAMKWYGRGYIADPDLRKLRNKIDRALEALDAYHGFSWLPANTPQHSPRRRWFALRCNGYGPEKLLQALPPKAHPFIAMLHSFDFDRRAWGSRQLGELGKAALPAVTHLIRMLGDVPLWSISTLYSKDPMKSVRAARIALIRIGEPVIPYLIQAIQKAHDGIAHEAGSVLQVIAKDKGRRIMTQLSRDPVPEIRKRAVAILGWTKHAEQKAWAEALLLEALQDTNRGVREQAARSLGRLNIRSSVPQNIRLGPTPPRQILEQTAFPITDLPYGRSWSPPQVGKATVTEVKKAGK